MRRSITTVALPVAGLLLVAGCGNTGDTGDTGDADDPAGVPTDEAVTDAATGDAEASVTATLIDADGTELGTVELTEVDGGTRLAVESSGLPAGFHGFHVHAIGACDPDSVSPSDPSQTGDFLSAGGHVGEGSHGTHAGDLPSLYVTDAGEGSLTTVTGAFAPADLLDGDGSAVLVHAGPDNFAHIPERYAPEGPDATTLGTGDAGGRIACGVLE